MSHDKPIAVWTLGLQSVTPFGIVCFGLNLTPRLWSLKYYRDEAPTGSTAHRFLVFFFGYGPLPLVPGVSS